MLLFSKNVSSHWINWYGFIPMCFLRFFNKMILDEKAFSQLLHWLGFSPVCLFIWSVRIQVYDNMLSNDYIARHSLSVCVSKWFVRWPFCNKSSSQLLHWYGFFRGFNPHVFCKIPIYGEVLITLAALLKCISIVCPQMYFNRNNPW